jgi:hypothetical protein
MNPGRGITGKSAVSDPPVCVAFAHLGAFRDGGDPFPHSVLARPRLAGGLRARQGSNLRPSA